MTIPEAFQVALQHHQAGRLAEAEALYRQILAAEPRHADALHLLGVIAHQLGRHELAVDMIGQAIALKPGTSAFHSNLGEAHRAAGNLDAAIAAYRRAIELDQDFVEALNNLGNALQDQGQLDEAIAAYRRALQLRPDYAEAHNNLGKVLKDQGEPEHALAEYDRALQLNPDYAEAHSNRGVALAEQGRFDEAITSFRRALKLRPDFAGVHSNLVYTLHFRPRHDDSTIAAEHDRWNREFAEPLKQFIPPHFNDRRPERRLRLGYVSPNFSRHVIRHFLTPLLECHDHANFEIYCYASTKRADPITERQRKCADLWRDVSGVRDAELAAMIREDGIDILVDLTQHMAENRLRVFARKPAPVQVTWLGNPGSTGLPAMDYRLTDARMDPEGASWSESVEEPLRLPDSWFCFDPIDEYPEPGELPAQRAGSVTFGCLNNFCKVNEAVFERWAEVMRSMAESRLVLQCPTGETQTRTRRFFESRGIESERLELFSRLPNRTEFLELYQRIDLALDPFPYNGGTTTCEALWMGVPVLTLPGNMVVSRQGLSILCAAGCQEFIAYSEAAYVSLAESLANDLTRLTNLRRTLRERMRTSPLMDGPRFARKVEQAYQQMWRTWCAKQSSLEPL